MHEKPDYEQMKAEIAALKADNQRLQAAYAKEWARKEWLTFSEYHEFSDDSSSMVKHHLLGNDKEGYRAMIAISNQPSGSMKHAIIAQGKTVDETIDLAIENTIKL